MPTPDFSKIWASNSPLPEFVFTDEEYTEGWDFVKSAPPTKNQFDAWFRYVDERLKWLYDEMQATASKMYPVGSVYISFNSADPSTLFGGTWQRLKDTFLLANGDSYAPNTSGGSSTKTIGVNNLPSHTHSCSTVGDHTHTRGSMNITGSVTANKVDSGIDDAFGSTGAFTAINGMHVVAQAGSGSFYGWEGFSFDASKSWTGSTSSNGSHEHTIGNTGSGLPLNIMPPYTTVYAWRRTA